MYTIMIQDEPTTGRRDYSSIIEFLNELNLDPVAATEYLVAHGDHSLQEAQNAVNAWLYSDNT